MGIDILMHLNYQTFDSKNNHMRGLPQLLLNFFVSQVFRSEFLHPTFIICMSFKGDLPDSIHELSYFSLEQCCILATPPEIKQITMHAG